MSYTITQVKEHLTAMMHGGTLNKIRNFNPLLERTANTVITKCDPITTMRTQPLVDLIHEDVFDYTLPSDYKKAIDLMPQEERDTNDFAYRQYAGTFDLKKMIADRVISVEAREGTKVLRVNWRDKPPRSVHNMDSLTANGTWSTVGSATNLRIDKQFKFSGSASVRFDLVATGDGIQNTDFQTLDLTNEDETADFFVRVYLPDITNVTSVSLAWGNDLTTNFWTGVAQTTQADGTAIQTGWNLFQFPWDTATETGTVDATAIDSAKVTIAASVALPDVRVDAITVSIGQPFNLKYYSAFLFQTSAGTYIRQPSDDTDVLLLDELSLNIFLNEALIEMAQQAEGEDSTFDITIASRRLNGDPTSPDRVLRKGLYAQYRVEYPSQSKKITASWFGSNSSIRRGRAGSARNIRT